MGVQKNATYKVHNGTDFDEINFKTIASQVKMASGIDLEAGFANLKAQNGYTKLPNGYVIQVGSGSFTGLSTGAWNSRTVTFAYNFPTACTAVIPVPNGAVYSYNQINTGAKTVSNSVVYMKPEGTTCEFFYIAIGY